MLGKSVRVTPGHIAVVPSQVAVIPIASIGDSFRKLHAVVQRECGGYFLRAALAQTYLCDGQAYLVCGDGHGYELSAFQNAIFIVDDGGEKLRDLTCQSLVVAMRAGFEEVTFPALRMSDELGGIDTDLDYAAREIAEGVRMFFDEYLVRFTITIVDDDYVVRRKLEEALKSA